MNSLFIFILIWVVSFLFKKYDSVLFEGLNFNGPAFSSNVAGDGPEDDERLM